jgi:hypothetical protein
MIYTYDEWVLSRIKEGDIVDINYDTYEFEILNNGL